MFLTDGKQERVEFTYEHRKHMSVRETAIMDVINNSHHMGVRVMLRYVNDYCQEKGRSVVMQAGLMDKENIYFEFHEKDGTDHQRVVLHRPNVDGHFYPLWYDMMMRRPMSSDRPLLVGQAELDADIPVLADLLKIIRKEVHNGADCWKHAECSRFPYGEYSIQSEVFPDWILRANWVTKYVPLKTVVR